MLKLYRLGSSMQGAFLLWDELLRGIVDARHNPSFLSALVRKVLEALTTKPGVNSQHDAVCEAHYLWLVHLLEYQDVDGSLVKHAPRNHVMKWCCLHPSYWTKQLGEQLLQLGDSRFNEQWGVLFEASQLARGTKSELAETDFGQSKPVCWIVQPLRRSTTELTL